MEHGRNDIMLLLNKNRLGALLLTLLSTVAITGCDESVWRSSSSEQVVWQERYFAQWTDALKKSDEPFRLFKITGVGCFVATWGADKRGGPALAAAPNQNACDDPTNARITTIFPLTGNTTHTPHSLP